jgi:hypothetical protein
MNLEDLLTRLVALQPKAQEIYEVTMREEVGDDSWLPDERVWLSLEYNGGDGRWHCGFRVRDDEATVWALRSVHRTPVGAAQAVIEDLLRG